MKETSRTTRRVKGSAPPVVEVASVSKSFRRHQVLNKVNLTVSQGEFVAVTGPSGSGKSTLLNLIGLLDTPDQGCVSLFGRPAPGINTSQARLILRHKLGYLFQNAALIDQDSVETNLRTAQKYSPTPTSHRAHQRQKALTTVGLGGLEQQKVYELSGGEQQRLALACLLTRDTELVLADEPTGSLDPHNRDTVLTLLQDLNHQGKTIIIVTHDPDVASAATRRISLE